MAVSAHILREYADMVEAGTADLDIETLPYAQDYTRSRIVCNLRLAAGVLDNFGATRPHELARMFVQPSIDGTAAAERTGEIIRNIGLRY
jgi:hypothetical protein